MAGFFLAVAQRNELQASYWRAHRHVYERLRVAPGILESLKDIGGDVVGGNLDVVKLLLTPVPVHIFKGRKDASPQLETISAMADLIQRAKDAAKEVAKDAADKAGKG